jgi:hypothetical protein
VDFSFVIGIGSSGGDAIAIAMDPPPIAVRVIPDPAAFKKFLLENLMFQASSHDFDTLNFQFIAGGNLIAPILSKQQFVVQF